ncbi:MAG: C1 family peptidase [Opitutales bacterium]|nr:C1 family peptidase [Opitutales bacterium]
MSHSSEITQEEIKSLRKSFENQPLNRLMQNAVGRTSIHEIALNREVMANTPDAFSVKLDEWKVTDQKRSGRCWCFAGMNMLRAGVMKRLNISNFEFSQNYILFWDKFERANFFLNAIQQTSDQPLDDREVAFLLDHPLDDGGQWNMFVSIVEKHGLIPQYAMRESESSSSTALMNRVLLSTLREAAKDIRKHYSDEAKTEQTHKETLKTIWRILCIHLGTPPEEFTWQYEDKDNVFHRGGVMTPQEFAREVVKVDLKDFVCLVNDPRNPTGQTYTVKFLGNVVGGSSVVYLNVDIETLKKVTMNSLKNGMPVWMGCDVGKHMERTYGIWDAQLYDYKGVYSHEFSLNKEDRLNYHETQMTHAMLFTGVDISEGSPQRWRVENSWGEKIGQKGFFTMNDNWFDEYMFEVAADKEMLSEELQEALTKAPVELEPWDPMGALARQD